jgi:ParB-like chromosome segregation protein Spo0J
MQTVDIAEIKPNPSNPRLIKDDKFHKLVQSLKDFPEMASVRPIVVNQNMVILGGNMRFKAMKEAKWKEIPVEIVDWDEAKQREFIIKDNVSFGEWDWDDLANNWDAADLSDWGLDIPQIMADVDYSILDDENLSGQLADMADGVKKAIQIEFETKHYEEAFELVKFWRERKAYVGGMIMEYLKYEKEKI